jgi:hypothetical protein
MKVNAPKAEDLTGGGLYLKAPGWYHMLITNLMAGLGPKGTAIDGFTAECKVMAGLSDDGSDNTGKEISLTLFAPKLTAKPAAQKNDERKLTAFFVATNCILPEQLGQEIEIDENLANGAQFVVKLATGQSKNDAGEYEDDPDAPIQIHYSDIFHVDDPAVAKIPKSAESVALIDPKDRHPAEWFAWKKKGPKAPAEKVAASNLSDEIF